MSGAISYWRRKSLDLTLALMLLAGGIIGTAVGVWLFTLLRTLGQLDITIGLSYVLLLGIVGALMVTESVRAILRGRQGKPVELRRPGSHTWIHGLPFKLRFKRSHIYVSAIPVWSALETCLVHSVESWFPASRRMAATMVGSSCSGWATG